MWLLATVAVSSLEYYRELSRRGSPRQRIARLGVSCCFPPCAQGFPAGKNTMPASTLGAAVLDVLTWSERMTRERERLGSLRQYFITGETGRSSNSGSVQSRTFALSRLQFRGLQTQLFLTALWFLSP